MRWLGCLAILSLAVPLWAGEPPAITLGLVLPSAGEAGRLRQSMLRAAELAVADGSQGFGRRVELDVQDDEFDPRQAVSVAEAFVRGGAWGVVGHFYSSSSIPASAIYQQAGLPMVTPASTHPRLTAQGFDTVFRVIGRDDQQALTAAEFLLTRLRARRIAVIHDRTEFGRTLAETLGRAVERQAGRRILTVGEVAQGDTDFLALAARLKALQPDAVYFGGVFREAGYLVRQMRQAGLGAVFVSGDAVLDPEFVKLAGEDAATGTYLTSAPDPRRLPTAQALVRRFEARYGAVGPYVLQTYDALGVLLSAIRRAQPLANSPEELRKVARALRGGTYDGALGRLRWDTNGDLTASPYVLYVTKRGGGLHGWFEQVSGNAADRGTSRAAGR